MWNSCCILRNGSCAFLDNLHTTYKVATFILPFSDEETEASNAFLRPGIYLQKSQYLTGNWDNDTHGMSVHKWYGSTELEEFWQRSKCQVFFTHCFPWKCNCEDSVSPMSFVFLKSPGICQVFWVPALLFPQENAMQFRSTTIFTS